ncbi:PAS domain S-box protein [Mesoterricola silvestris]|uniref:histidine kinase n=1 Tax=Mesoterricola silvestris TaxID=2927979 RepID=A0AA48K7S2_9BACT|nr:PAS domain S-box protein [Mesoterricola silvestris]BDU71405.1 hypothetical protein METEAL_05790 [Mesoterricola silvestris]
MKIRRPAWLNSLTITVVVTMLLALGFQTWMLMESRQRALEIITTRAANRAQATAHRVQEILKEVDLILQDVREHVVAEDLLRGPAGLTPKREADMRIFLRHQAAKIPQVLLLHVVGPDGRYVFSTVDPLPTVNIADRPYFQEQRDAISDELRVSDPVLGRHTHRWGIHPNRRIATADGRFAGIVFATLDTETLGSVMVAVDQSQWVLALHAMDHQLIARSPAGPIGTRVVEPRMDSIWKGPITFEGVAMGEPDPQIWAGWQVPGTSLYTVAGFAKARALAQWHRDLKINAAVACLLVAGCAGILVLQKRNRDSAESAFLLQERLAIAGQGAGIGIFDWDLVKSQLHWDDSLYRLLGLRREDLPSPGWNWFDQVDARDQERVRRDFEAALGKEELHVNQFRVRWPDGSVRHLRVAARSLRDPSGRVIRMVGIVYDVTEAEEAQEALKGSEAYFRTLFEAVPAAVAVLRGDEVIDANPRYVTMFQAAAPPWVLAPVRQPDGSHSRDHGERLAAAAQTGTAQRIGWQCQRADGSLFDSELTVTRFRHQENDLLMVIVRDLTAIREMEIKLHQAQKMDALGQLAGGVAHDFNNMLSAIRSAAELLHEEVQGERPGRLASTIMAAADRAGQLTRQLLAFARKGKILSTPTDVHQILQEAVTLLERTIDRRIVIEQRLLAADATVVGDPTQIQSALLNLGVNARDAMPEGGLLTFATETVAIRGDACAQGGFRLEPGEHLHVSVADQGCGIPEANLGQIFDPFFTTKEVNKGTGLGLAAVFGTMVSHKGAVTVESREGKGTVFHLYLPLAHAGVRQAGPAAAGPLPTGTGRVLVVEDEDLVRTATTMAIESLGYEVHAVADAEGALAHFAAHHRGLRAVILDMVLPGSSGAKVAAALRAIDPGVPIVLVSGFPRNADVGDLLGEGIAGFLQKPLDRRELGDLLAALA